MRLWTRVCGKTAQKTHVSGSWTECVWNWGTDPAGFEPGTTPRSLTTSPPARCSGRSETAAPSRPAGTDETSGTSRDTLLSVDVKTETPGGWRPDWGYLCDLLCGDFYCMLLFAAVIQRRTIHVLVVKQGQFLHLVPNPCDFILDLRVEVWRELVDRRTLNRAFMGQNGEMFLYLIHPLYPFGGKFLGNSNSSFRIQTDPWHQGHSIISQL